LRVEVDQKHALTRLLRGDANGRGKGCFPGAALLGQECNDFHEDHSITAFTYNVLTLTHYDATA
jgi:hypothetical protein